MRFFLKKSFSDGLRSMNHPIFNPNRATASGHGKTDNNTCGKDKKRMPGHGQASLLKGNSYWLFCRVINPSRH